jgi:hypothetical protein
MSKLSNLNYNHISVKPESTVKLIKELSKLGLFRKKSSKRPKSSVADAIRQDNEMVGYTRSLGGPQLRNIAPIQQITAGLSQSQIEDIQRSNNAAVAALRAEVEQSRNETQRLSSGVTRLTNLASERFRGAQLPGAGQPIDPFVQSTTIEEIPDTNEERFNETLNEGAPELTPEPQQTLYAGGELPEGLPFLEIGDVVPESIKVRQKTGGDGAVMYLSERKMKDIDSYWGIGPIPKTREVKPLREYLTRINKAIGSDYNTSLPREDLMKNIRAGLREAYEKIDE